MPAMALRSAPGLRSRIPLPVPRKPDPRMHRHTISAPSKLEMIQWQLQRKLMREKEAKLVAMYEKNQEQALQRVGFAPPQRTGAVRDFFRERNELGQNDKNYNIHQHYRQKKDQYARVSPQHTWPENKPPLPHRKGGDGMQRNTALSPLKNRPQGPNMGNDTYNKPPPFESKPRRARVHRRGTPQSDSDQPQGYSSELENHPPTQHATLLRSRKNQLQRLNSRLTDDEDDAPAPGRNNSFQQWKLEQERKRMDKQANGQQSPETKKPSSFQKWQQEQDEARDQRLAKHRRAQEEQSDSGMASGHTTPVSPSKPPKHNKTRSQAMKARQYARSPSQAGSEEGRSSSRPPSVIEDDIRRKEEQLKALLEKRTRELEQMKVERDKEEEQLRLEEEQRRKRAAAIRERQRKAREQRERTPEPSSSRTSSRGASYATESDMEPPPKQKPVMVKAKPKQKYVPPKPRTKSRTEMANNEPPPEPNEHTAMYVDMASAEDAHAEIGDLQPCSICGRKFASDRLAKHKNVCSKQGAKKRKVFDPVKMRTEGTELAQYANNHRKENPPKKKSDWKKKHEDFIKSLRYAKQVAAVQSQGGDIAALPPPPPSENPDYVQCPHCERKFNGAAAERHIPKCSSIKSRAPPPPRGNRRRR